MPFGLANVGSVYSRMLNVSMEEVDRDFWTSYLDDILTYSGEPWAHFGHLTSVVWHMGQLESRNNPAKPSCSSPKWSTWGTRSAKEVYL